MTANTLMLTYAGLGLSCDYDSYIQIDAGLCATCASCANSGAFCGPIFTSATSSFTAPESGYYVVGCTVCFCGTSGSYTGASTKRPYSIELWKNGSCYCKVDDYRVTSTAVINQTMSLIRVLELSKGDAITFYCSGYWASGRDRLYQDTTTSAYNVMFMHRIGGATF